MTLMRWLLACSLAACGSPSLQCPDLTSAPVNGRCSYPEHAIAIDGDLGDWANVPELLATCTTCFCDGCTAGQVYTMRATPTTDGNVALLVDTGGAPRTGTGDAYIVGMFPLDGPQYTFAVRTFASQPPVVLVGDITVAGMPVQAAYGATGIELELPIDALPFGGGFLADATVEHVAIGGWNYGQDVVPTIATCWDASAPSCRPR